ncbi:MAG: SRPBCC family protein [Chlamydiales bacterium]|nr:SRPBCC family protein [Chlamydiales bacterium]
MFRWTLTAEVKTKADPNAIWDLWVDVPSWPKWDHELEWCSLDGPFKVGTTGKLKPKGWLASTFRLISVEEGKAHSDRTEMPFTKIIFNHSLSPCENGEVTIVHQVEVCGLLAPLLWLTMRRAIKKGLPQAVNRLAQLAELKTQSS